MDMKGKAMQILRENVEWFYTYYYSRPRNSAEIDSMKNEMGVVYETLRDLGLVTREEYIAMKAEAREKYKKQG